MPRKLNEIIAHIRMVAANPNISTTLIQTEDLEVLCGAAEDGDSRRSSTLKSKLEPLNSSSEHPRPSPSFGPVADLRRGINVAGCLLCFVCDGRGSIELDCYECDGRGWLKHD